MSEIVAQDSQAMQRMLCSARVDWGGLSTEVAREANRMLGGKSSALIIDEFAQALYHITARGNERRDIFSSGRSGENLWKSSGRHAEGTIGCAMPLAR